MNATDKQADLTGRVVAGSATDETPTGHGSPRLRPSYREDMNEALAVVNQGPVDFETVEPVTEDTPIASWNSDMVDAEAAISFVPDD